MKIDKNKVLKELLLRGFKVDVVSSGKVSVVGEGFVKTLSGESKKINMRVYIPLNCESIETFIFGWDFLGSIFGIGDKQIAMFPDEGDARDKES